MPPSATITHSNNYLTYIPTHTYIREFITRSTVKHSLNQYILKRPWPQMWLWYFKLFTQAVHEIPSPEFFHTSVWTHDLQNIMCSSLASSTSISKVRWNSVHYIMLARPTVHVPAWCSPLWPWTLTFWLQKLKCSSWCRNALMLKVWQNSVEQFARHRIDNAKKCICQQIGNQSDLQLRPFSPKSRCVQRCPKCTNAESLVK